MRQDIELFEELCSLNLSTVLFGGYVCLCAVCTQLDTHICAPCCLYHHHIICAIGANTNSNPIYWGVHVMSKVCILFLPMRVYNIMYSYGYLTCSFTLNVWMNLMLYNVCTMEENRLRNWLNKDDVCIVFVYNIYSCWHKNRNRVLSNQHYITSIAL